MINQHKQFEALVEIVDSGISTDELKVFLNELGKRGWKVQCTIPHGIVTRLVLYRELKNTR